MAFNKKVLWALPFIALGGYWAGPAPQTPVYQSQLPTLPSTSEGLEAHVRNRETAHRVKADNEARIVWYQDSLKQPTEYAIVYLHGFSASQFEGAPVHRNIAQFMGANLYLSRLAGHGIDTSDPLADLHAEAYWQSACDALAVGKQIGKKVILMGTSTGSSQALQLAAAFPESVAGLILYSPNIAINDPNAWVLNNHWGLQLARLVTGGPYRKAGDDRAQYKQYWYGQYRLEGTVALEEMLETTMHKETFEKVKQPVLMLYYYKDEKNQDPVVKVSAMREMFDQLGTPSNLKREKAMPLTGDHVIASPLKSGDVAGVEAETKKFIREILQAP